MTSWGITGGLGAFSSILQIWGNPTGCETSPKSMVPLLWGPTAKAELRGLAGTLRPWLHERKKFSVCRSGSFAQRAG